MTQNVELKSPAVFSMLAGVLFAVSGVLFLFFQVGRFDWASVKSISIFLEANPSAPYIWKLINWAAALASFLAIANVQALVDQLQAPNRAMPRWGGTLATIGYSIIAVTNIADLYQIQHTAERLSTAGETARAAIEVLGLGSLDPQLTLRFVSLGPWFLTAGFVAMRRGSLPRSLGALGLSMGIASMLVVAANWFEANELTLLATPVAVILHPVWLIWTGLVLSSHDRAHDGRGRC